MATTIARRIRRIGLLPAVKNEKGVIIQRPREELSPNDRIFAVQTIRQNHYVRRHSAKKNPKAKPHRRSKARVKADKKAAA
jgi:hypothetical protein